MAGIVVIGGSAGGIEALTDFVRGLPRDLDAPVLIVVHVPARFPSRLPEILARKTSLDVAHALHGEALRPGTIRIAPPDNHLVVDVGRIHLGRTAAESFHRPSIDVLFRSAANSYGDQVVAVILSGGAGDGIAGLEAVRLAGGAILVQDPADALFGALPASAIELFQVDHVASAAKLGSLVAQIAGEAAGQHRRAAQAGDEADDTEPTEEGGWRPSVFACPDCTGTLWELESGRLVRFRCRIGHSYGAEALIDGKGEELESALWSAINTMQERGELAQRLARRAAEHGFQDTSQRYARTAEDMQRQARQIRELVATWTDPQLQAVPEPDESSA